MDLLLLHPKVVHLPIALAVLMPLVGAGVLLAWWRGWYERRVWLIVTLLQLTLVGSGLVAMKTGEEDAEVVERVVDEAEIHEHEEAAELFEWAAAAVLLLMIAALFMRPEPVAKGVAAASVIGTLVVFGLGVRVGEAGGDLVYEHGAPAAHQTTTLAAEMPRPDALDRRGDDDDDD